MFQTGYSHADKNHHIGAHCRKEPGSFSSPSAHDIVLTTAQTARSNTDVRNYVQRVKIRHAKTSHSSGTGQICSLCSMIRTGTGHRSATQTLLQPLLKAAAHRPDQHTDGPADRQTNPQIDRQTDRQRQGQTGCNIRASLQILHNNTRELQNLEMAAEMNALVALDG